ncbi:hypothetical protein [Nostoc sp.]|uniref:hypothetical protein n=1 Tax=Nostoc sp. TaxID=1180 RepID=UPI002FF613BC
MSHCGGQFHRHKGGSAPLRFPDLYSYGEASYVQRLRQEKQLPSSGVSLCVASPVRAASPLGKIQ